MPFIVFIFCSAAQITPPLKEWHKDFGGTDWENFTAIQKTSDGGYILGGWSKSGIGGDHTEDSRGESDYWIVKIDAAGKKQWDKRYGGNADDQLTSLQQTTDGGYILGGTSYSGISGDKSEPLWGLDDYWIVKVDATGIKQWDKSYGGSSDDELTSIQQTTDGGYILGGYSSSVADGNKTDAGFGSYDYWVIKIDANGTQQWDKDFGGTNVDELTCMKPTADGGYILGGNSLSGISGNKTADIKGYGHNYWIAKITPDGTMQWDKDFSGLNDDYLYAVQQTIDGGYIIGGVSWSGIGGDKTEGNKGSFGIDMWVIKTNADGIKQWDKDYGGSGNDDLASLYQTTDGGYLFGGSSNSPVSGDKSENTECPYDDYWVIKTDSAGTKQWDKDYGGSIDQHLISVQETNDLGYILGGFSESNAGGDKTQNSQGSEDFWIIKMKSDVLLPISLSNFKAIKQQNQALLTWQTSSDNPINYFNIERSIDGKTFTIIGKTNAKIKNNKTISYSYSDNIATLTANKIYYRLQAIQKDDEPSYSAICTVNNLSTGLFTISPNPAKHSVNIMGSNLKQVQLYDFSGRQVLIQNVSVLSINKIDISFLQPGIYLVKMIDINEHVTTSELKIQ